MLDCGGNASSKEIDDCSGGEKVVVKQAIEMVAFGNVGSWENWLNTSL